MGEIADSLIDGEFDYITGEYIGPPCGYPRTIERPGNFKKIIPIRRELRRLTQEKQKGLTTQKEMHHARELARQEINKKYGKGWRDNI